MTQLLAPKMSPIEITRLLSVAVNVYSPNQYIGIIRMVRTKSAILSFLLCSDEIRCSWIVITCASSECFVFGNGMCQCVFMPKIKIALNYLTKTINILFYVPGQK